MTFAFNNVSFDLFNNNYPHKEGLALIDKHDKFLQNLSYQISSKEDFFGKIEDYKAKLNDCILMIEEKLKSTVYKDLYREVLNELISRFKK